MRAPGDAHTIQDLVERNARLHGDSLFQVFGERRQTFRQYAERARRLASALHAGGVRSQDRVAILAMNCPEYLEVYGVGEVAPFIVAPVNFRLAPPEILYVLRDAAPAVLFFEKQYEATIASLRDQLSTIRRYVCIDGAAPDWAEDYEASPCARFAGRSRARSLARTHSRRHVHERHDGPAEGRDADARRLISRSSRTGRASLTPMPATASCCRCRSFTSARDRRAAP